MYFIIVGKEWVNVAHIRIPSEHIHYENYHNGQCVSSVLYHNDLFTIEYLPNYLILHIDHHGIVLHRIHHYDLFVLL